MTIGIAQLASGVARQVEEMMKGVVVETPWPEGVSVLYVGAGEEALLPFDTMALTVTSLDLSRVVDERFARPSGFVATFVGGAVTEPPTAEIDPADGTVTVALPALPYLRPDPYWQDASGAYVSADRAAEADRVLRGLLQAALDRREKVIGSLGPLAQVVADDETDPALLTLARTLRSQFGTRLDLYTVADDARALRALAQKSS